MIACSAVAQCLFDASETEHVESGSPKIAAHGEIWIDVCKTESRVRSGVIVSATGIDSRVHLSKNGENCALLAKGVAPGNVRRLTLGFKELVERPRLVTADARYERSIEMAQRSKCRARGERQCVAEEPLGATGFAAHECVEAQMTQHVHVFFGDIACPRDVFKGLSRDGDPIRVSRLECDAHKRNRNDRAPLTSHACGGNSRRASSARMSSTICAE